MKLPNKMNPVHCASKDGTRYILNGVKIQGDLAIATDGRTLCVIKGERETDDDHRDALIPSRVAKAAWPQTKRGRGAMLPMLIINPQEPECAGLAGALTKTVLDKEFDKHTAKDIDGERYPKISKVVPDPDGHTLKVGINVNLLAQVAKSMGTDSVVIHLHPDRFSPSYTDPMFVTSANDDSQQAFCVQMPLRPGGLSGLQENEALRSVLAMKEAAPEDDTPPIISTATK